MISGPLRVPEDGPGGTLLAGGTPASSQGRRRRANQARSWACGSTNVASATADSLACEIHPPVVQSIPPALFGGAARARSSAVSAASPPLRPLPSRSGRSRRRSGRRAAPRTTAHLPKWGAHVCDPFVAHSAAGRRQSQQRHPRFTADPALRALLDGRRHDALPRRPVADHTRAVPRAAVCGIDRMGGCGSRNRTGGRSRMRELWPETAGITHARRGPSGRAAFRHPPWRSGGEQRAARPAGAVGRVAHATRPATRRRAG